MHPEVWALQVQAVFLKYDKKFLTNFDGLNNNVMLCKIGDVCMMYGHVSMV